MWSSLVGFGLGTLYHMAVHCRTFSIPGHGHKITIAPTYHTHTLEGQLPLRWETLLLKILWASRQKTEGRALPLKFSPTFKSLKSCLFCGIWDKKALCTLMESVTKAPWFISNEFHELLLRTYYESGTVLLLRNSKSTRAWSQHPRG